MAGCGVGHRASRNYEIGITAYWDRREPKIQIVNRSIQKVSVRNEQTMKDDRCCRVAMSTAGVGTIAEIRHTTLIRVYKTEKDP